MPFPRSEAMRNYGDRGNVLVTQAEIENIKRQARELMAGRQVSDPVWDFCYQVGRLGSQDRWRQFREEEGRTIRYFQPANAAEERVVRTLFWKATCFDGNVWVTELPDWHFHERLRQAYNLFRAKAWVDVWLGPATTLTFIAMVKRRWPEVAKKMSGLYEERENAAKARRAKRQAKEKKVKKTIKEMERFPCFTPEGGIVGNN